MTDSIHNVTRTASEYLPAVIGVTGVLACLIEVFYKLYHQKVNIVVKSLFFLSLLGGIIYFGYQSFWKGDKQYSTCSPKSEITIDVDGVLSTSEENNYSHLMSGKYRRVWDAIELTKKLEYDGIFIATDLAFKNQTIGTCPEQNVFRTSCQIKNNTHREYAGFLVNTYHCERYTPCGTYQKAINGFTTGKCCVKPGESNGTCEIYAWCPAGKPQSAIPDDYLFKGVHKFKVQINAYVEFPDCGSNFHGQLPLRYDNSPPNPNSAIPRCRFHKTNSLTCLKLHLGNIIARANVSFRAIAPKGGVFLIDLELDCNFDGGRTFQDCNIEYKFEEMKSKSKLGVTWTNIDYLSPQERLLQEFKGISIYVKVSGKARRISWLNILLSIGALKSVLNLLHEIFSVSLQLFSVSFWKNDVPKFIKSHSCLLWLNQRIGCCRVLTEEDSTEERTDLVTSQDDLSSISET